MSGLATTQTDRSVENFLLGIGNSRKEADSRKLINLFKEITQLEPKVWGNIKAPDFLIGFGKYRYTRKGSKEEFEWFHLGFAPRKSKLTLYLSTDLDQHKELLDRLGKCSWGRGCLYLNKLEDIDLEVLKSLILKTKNSRWDDSQT